jgi:uncharacterized protein YecE (DUF72 family)
MSLDLFGESAGDSAPDKPRAKKASPSKVEPVAFSDELRTLAAQLPSALRMGTSSWYFPGWSGLVWQEPYAEQKLSREGLRAYAHHPLMRTVSLDRAFYRPMTAEQYAQLSAQVPDDFRFVVKVPSVISDALIRHPRRETEGESAGNALRPNPHFLSPQLMTSACIEPLARGMGHKLGVLVLQMSPLPHEVLLNFSRLFEALARILIAQSAIKSVVPEAIVAVEVRNPELLREPMRSEFVQVLKAAGATYCLGSHAKLSPISEQLPILRALWPGPLVCRWNLHAKHGQYGYSAAKSLYEPFDRLVDEDLDTRMTLAKVIKGTTGAGHKAFVTINNKAEGSAPLSVGRLAQAIAG